MLIFVLPTERSSFNLDIFSNISATKANLKETKPPKNVVDAGVMGYLSKVNLDFF